jgi:hypothetical protein
MRVFVSNVLTRLYFSNYSCCKWTVVQKWHKVWSIASFGNGWFVGSCGKQGEMHYSLPPLGRELPS